MATEVVMPQMGESIAEGTITKWLKNVGDQVERDEPLFEISTDKVDAEIPAPATGVLSEIKVPEGTYRIDLETQAGETLSKRPDQTQVNNSDLDSARDFEVTGPTARD